MESKVRTVHRTSWPRLQGKRTASTTVCLKFYSWARRDIRAAARSRSLALIELQSAVSSAQTISIRKEPLVPEEQVVTLVYPGGHQQLVVGRFVRFGDGGKLAGMVLLQLYEGDDRLVIDHGASGAIVTARSLRWSVTCLPGASIGHTGNEKGRDAVTSPFVLGFVCRR
jgi:hypothetical protein